MSADLFRVCGQYTHGKKPLKKPPWRKRERKKPNEKCTPTKLFSASLCAWKLFFIPVAAWAGHNLHYSSGSPWPGASPVLTAVLLPAITYGEVLRETDIKLDKLGLAKSGVQLPRVPWLSRPTLKYLTLSTCKHTPADMLPILDMLPVAILTTAHIQTTPLVYMHL